MDFPNIQKGVTAFHSFLDEFLKNRPTVIESFLVLSSIEIMMKASKENIWNEMMKTFPGSEDQKEAVTANLLLEATKLANQKPDLHKRTLWVPKTKIS